MNIRRQPPSTLSTQHQLPALETSGSLCLALLVLDLENGLGGYLLKFWLALIYADEYGSVEHLDLNMNILDGVF
jgi:hypothetical protein